MLRQPASHPQGLQERPTAPPQSCVPCGRPGEPKPTSETTAAGGSPAAAAQATDADRRCQSPQRRSGPEIGKGSLRRSLGLPPVPASPVQGEVRQATGRAAWQAAQGRGVRGEGAALSRPGRENVPRPTVPPGDTPQLPAAAARSTKSTARRYRGPDPRARSEPSRGNPVPSGDTTARRVAWQGSYPRRTETRPLSCASWTPRRGDPAGIRPVCGKGTSAPRGRGGHIRAVSRP